MIRRRTALCLAASLLLVGVPAGAADEPGSGFSNYRLKANAPGLALTGLYRDVALTVPEVTSSLQTGGIGAGLASLAWPGPLLGNAGTTILVVRPDAPPETTLLDSPVRAEARTGGVDEATSSPVPGTLMAATAEEDEVTARSSFSDLQLPLGTAGGITSESRVALEGAAEGVVEATSSVTDLVLADGALRIGSVVSTASATSDGATSKGAGRTTVSGVEIAGVPVTVDEDGISVAGQGAALPLPQDAVNGAIAALGLQAFVTAPTTTTSGGTTSYDAGALVLLFEQGGDSYALTLGRASVDVAAAPAVAVDPSAAPAAPEAPAPVAPAPAPVDVPAPAPDVPVADLPAAPAPDVALPEAPAEAPAAPPAVAPVAAPVTTTFVPVAFALAGGAPGLAALAGLVLVGAAATGLLRLPVRVLSPAAAASCPLEGSSR